MSIPGHQRTPIPCEALCPSARPDKGKGSTAGFVTAEPLAQPEVPGQLLHREAQSAYGYGVDVVYKQSDRFTLFGSMTLSLAFLHELMVELDE
jgi:hypothetical protein